MRNRIRLSLRWKIAGGFGLLLVLIGLLGWVTLSLFNSTRAVQRQVFDRALPQLIAVDEIIRSFTAQSAAIRGYVISTEQELLSQYLREVDIASDWEQRALELDPPEAERALFMSLIEAGNDFQTLVDEQVLPLAVEGQRSQAFRVLGQDGTPLINRIERLGENLRAAQDRLVLQTEQDVRDRQNQVVAILIVVLLGVFVMGLALAILLPRRLVRDLHVLVHAARGIERGDFNQTIWIRSGDEVEELAMRFESMQAGLKRLQQLALQDRELDIAASIQRNLLQRSIPVAAEASVVPLQRQANLVGGDWYDFELAQGHLTAVIGDASGKGIAAALMATVTLSALRAEHSLGAPPHKVIDSANKALLEATETDSFTTVNYVRLELATGVVRWLNMGHLDPYLITRPEDGTFTGSFVDGPRNRALGWFDKPGLEEHVLQLAPGDRLILYTDGFTEAKSATGELFGEERLGECLLRLAPLGPAELGEELVGEVERFAAGKLDDDLTMLLLEYTGSEGPDGS